MRISTIVLNWNRKTLLEKWLQSYAATIDSPFQLIVIDDASSDGSSKIMEPFFAKSPGGSDAEGFQRLLPSRAPAAQSIASGLDMTWPNEPEDVRPAVEEFLRPRHRHYQFDTDPDPPYLGHLTICAWRAVQHCLGGNEAAAQGIFDEINATLEEVDRMSFPAEEATQRRFFALEVERNGLRNRLANSEASLKLQLEANLRAANDQISSLKNVVEALNGRISSMLASCS